MRSALWLLAVAACSEHGRPGVAVDAADAPEVPDPDARTPEPIIAMPAFVDFGTMTIGHPTAPATITFSTPVNIVFLGPDAAAFSTAPGDCAPSATCALRFTATKVGPSTAMLVGHARGASVVVDLRGTGAPEASLQIAPSVHDYGAVGVGTTSSRTFMLTNVTGVTTGPLSATLAGPDAAQFAKGTDTCTGATLSPGGTCTVGVAFSPAQQGTKAASLEIAGTPGGSVAASLLGSGATGAGLTITPAMFDFGAVGQGNSSLGKMFTVTNNGGSTTGMLATSMGGNHPGDFLKQFDQCHGRVLAPGTGCSLFVTFEPGPVGTRNARVQIAASPGGSTAADLSGTCTP